MTNAIEIKELKQLLSIGDTVTLLDVRRRADYEAAPQKIAGAEWQDPEKIDAWAAQLPAGNRTVVYCVKGGSVGQSVVERLRREGLDALFLEGGLKAWIDNGQPVQDVPPADRTTYEIQASDKDYTLWSLEERIVSFMPTASWTSLRTVSWRSGRKKKPKTVSRKSYGPFPNMEKTTGPWNGI